MSNIYFFIYDDYAQFEVSILGYLLKQHGHNIISVSSNQSYVNSCEGFKTVADMMLEDVKVDDVDVWIIPGGKSYQALGSQRLQSILNELDQKGILLAAICHGPVLLAEAGVLKGREYTTDVQEDEPEYLLFKGRKLDTDVLQYDNIITAKGNGFIDFAFEVCNKLEVFKDEGEKIFYYNFFHNIKENGHSKSQYM